MWNLGPLKHAETTIGPTIMPQNTEALVRNLGRELAQLFCDIFVGHNTFAALLLILFFLMDQQCYLCILMHDTIMIDSGWAGLPPLGKWESECYSEWNKSKVSVPPDVKHRAEIIISQVFIQCWLKTKDNVHMYYCIGYLSTLRTKMTNCENKQWVITSYFTKFKWK